MKKFTIKNDTFIKNNSSSFKIMDNIIISLIPLVLLSIYKNINQAFMFVIPLLMGILIKMLVNNKNYFDIREIMITSLILGILIPINSNVIIVIVSSIITHFISLIANNGVNKYRVNSIIVGLLIIFLGNKLFNISNDICLFNSLNSYKSFEYNSIKEIILYLLKNGALFLAFSYCFLVLGKSMKKTIVNYFLLLSFCMSLIINLINGFDMWNLVIYMLNGITMFTSIYLVANIDNSPLRIKSQAIYGAVLGVVTTFINYYSGNYIYLFLALIIGNIFVTFLDSYKFNKKNV